MSIPESVTREMESFHRNSCYPECGNKPASDAARRVILALAGEMPEDAVEKAVQTWLESASDYTRIKESVRAAIAAFLKHVAGETP